MKLIGVFSILGALVIITSVSAFAKAGEITASEEEITSDSGLTDQSFKQIADNKIAFEASTAYDFIYDPYDITALMTEFNAPADVEPLKVQLLEQGEGQVTADGYVYTPYTVRVEQTYNPGSKFSSDQTIVINVGGGSVSLDKYEPFINKDEWKEKVASESAQWKSENYYRETGLAQDQSLDYGDSFFVLLTQDPVENSVEIGNGLMEINGDSLVNNDDVNSEMLSLTEIEGEINAIYNN